MIINVTPELRIDGSDGLCWTIQKKKVTGERSKNAGEEYWSDQGHYGNLEQACISALHKHLAGAGESTLMTILEAIDEFRISMVEALSQIHDTHNVMASHMAKPKLTVEAVLKANKSKKHPKKNK